MIFIGSSLGNVSRDGCKVFYVQKKSVQFHFYIFLNYLYFYLFHFSFFTYVLKQGKLHKMLKSETLQTICFIKFFMCEGKVSNFIYLILIYIDFIFINNQCKQQRMLKRTEIFTAIRIRQKSNFII